MRNVVASSLLALSLLTVPAVAAAAETAAPAAQVTASAPESREDFERRPQLTLGLDGNDQGVGFRIGLRFRWFEAELGSDTLIFDHREFMGLKLIPLPGAMFSPYVYGRMGSWTDEGFLTDDIGGDYQAIGGGVDVNATKHFFLYGEGGAGERLGEQSTNTAAYAEVHLGLGLRF